jgi:hypothetical protein
VANPPAAEGLPELGKRKWLTLPPPAGAALIVRLIVSLPDALPESVTCAVIV